MRQFSFFLGLILRRQERIPAEIEFLGFEAFTRPTEAIVVRTTSSQPAKDRRHTPASDSADKKLPKAA